MELEGREAPQPQLEISPTVKTLLTDGDVQRGLGTFFASLDEKIGEIEQAGASITYSTPAITEDGTYVEVLFIKGASNAIPGAVESQGGSRSQVLTYAFNLSDAREEDFMPEPVNTKKVNWRRTSDNVIPLAEDSSGIRISKHGWEQKFRITAYKGHHTQNFRDVRTQLGVEIPQV